MVTVSLGSPCERVCCRHRRCCAAAPAAAAAFVTAGFVLELALLTALVLGLLQRAEFNALSTHLIVQRLKTMWLIVCRRVWLM
jgi:hypothetical protein